MMQSDLFISSVAGPLLSVSSDFLFHVSSTLPPSFHYPCGLFVLVRSRRAESARLVLMRSCSIVFPSRKRATVSPVVVCRVVLSDRRARRQTKEGMLDQRLMRSRKCRREKFLGIPFYSTVAGIFGIILVSRSNRLRFGMARGFLQQENRRRVECRRVVFLIKVLFIFSFFELRIIIFSRERIRFRTIGIAHWSRGTFVETQLLQ